MTSSTTDSPNGGDSSQASSIHPLVTSDSVTYSYDNLGRLTGLTFLNTTTRTINYDAVGNRTSDVTACSGGGC
jgi:YD repeat-containing protein